MNECTCIKGNCDSVADTSCSHCAHAQISWWSAFHFMQTEHRWRQQQWHTDLFISPLLPLLVCPLNGENVMSTKDEADKILIIELFSFIFILTIFGEAMSSLTADTVSSDPHESFSTFFPPSSRLVMNTFLLSAPFTLRPFHFNGSTSARRVK